MRSTTNADVVLDANVIVGFLDPSDAQHRRAVALLEQMRSAGRELVLLEFLVEEALSVLCRRAQERKSDPLNLEVAISTIRSWQDDGQIESMSEELSAAFSNVLELVSASKGALNSNDAKLVYLQQAGVIGEVASFDAKLMATPDFQCVGRV